TPPSADGFGNVLVLSGAGAEALACLDRCNDLCIVGKYGCSVKQCRALTIDNLASLDFCMPCSCAPGQIGKGICRTSFIRFARNLSGSSAAAITYWVGDVWISLVLTILVT